MPWLTVDFHPGFAEDLTSWGTEIERDGRLRQSVRICRYAPRESRTEQHEAVLSPDQIAELERLIAATDFTAVAAASKRVCIDDAEHIYIRVEGSPEWVISAPLLFWHLLQRRDKSLSCPALADAIRLWQAIDRVSPHRLGD
jgi:hypothetical protein